MTLAAPANISRPPTRVLRQDTDGTRGQKTAEEDGGRSAPVPEPRAVVLSPGYRVQLGADLLILRRAHGSMVAAFSALGADPSEVEMETEKGSEERPRHGLAGYSERSSISLSMFSPDRGQISSQLLATHRRNRPDRNLLVAGFSLAR